MFLLATALWPRGLATPSINLEAPGALLTTVIPPNNTWRFPAYCAKVSADLVPLRSIPTLGKHTANLELTQVLTIVRHGARTPADRYNCWADYTPEWDCNVDLAVQGRLSNTSLILEGAGISPFTPFSGVHPKLYDVNPQRNVLGGNCQKGQLLSEGFQQHQIIGHWLAKAYQLPNDAQRVPNQNAPPLLDLSRADKDIYFRSSDMQRTIVSGGSLLASFFSTATKGHPESVPLVPLHTMDLGRETIFPNTAACPALLPIRDAIFASSGYLALRSKWTMVEERLRIATGRSDISDVWPGELFDCVLTAVCPGTVERLPPGLHPTMTIVDQEGKEKSLIDALIEAVDDYAQFEYKFTDAAFSKIAIAHAMVDLKSEIVRALLDRAEKAGHNATEVLSAAIGSSSQALEFMRFINDGVRPITGGQNDARKLVVYAGHDTTLMPFLASLGGTVYDNKWPPYASQVAIEIYNVQNDPVKAFFRLIYNGAVLTKDLPGCTQSASAGSTEICPVAVFFECTQWATPTRALKMCEGSAKEDPLISIADFQPAGLPNAGGLIADIMTFRSRTGWLVIGGILVVLTAGSALMVERSMRYYENRYEALQGPSV